MFAKGTVSWRVQLPVIPEPVAVSLDPRTTALLSLDMVESLCPQRVRCMEGVPAAAVLLELAREHGVLVVHTGTSAQVTDVAPQPGEIVIRGNGPDKFVETNLDSSLRRRGIDTLVIQGFAADRAVMYTAMDATMRGYTVVVPADASPGSATPFDALVAHYQLLTQTGRTNVENAPLAEEAVTLTRTDLITFR